jgi:hypothetical protein
MVKIFFTVILFSIFFYTGCGGHEPNPVALHQVGDDKRSCESLRLEIAQNEAVITKKLKKDEGKLWTNTLWFLFFTPAMDLKEAEKTEAESLQHRNAVLKILMAEKGCGATAFTDLKETSNDTEKEAALRKEIEKITNATECSRCGRHIAKGEELCIYEGKRVCPECFKELTK